MVTSREKLFETMQDADYVMIDGVVFEADYLRVPDEYTVSDDVVLEASSGDTEIDLTRGELDGAVGLGQDVFRLRNGTVLRFLTSAVIH